MKDRNLPPWNIVKAALPVCLQTDDTPVCLLIQCLSDILLEWVYAAMSEASFANRIDQPKANTTDDSRDVIMNQVQRFFGWSIFSLTQKLQNQQRDNKDSLKLLERMSVLHHKSCHSGEAMTNKDNHDMSSSTLQSLYAALTKKTIHAWAGMMSRRLKELYTGRQAKNTTKLALCVQQEASSKKKKATADKTDRTNAK